MLPAVGQGAIAIETRSDDDFAVRRRANWTIVRRVWHVWRSARFCAVSVAVASYQSRLTRFIERDSLKLDGLVARPMAQSDLRDSLSGPPETAEALGALPRLAIDRTRRTFKRPLQ